MPLFSKKDKDKEAFEDYSTLSLPFITDDILRANLEKAATDETPVAEKTASADTAAVSENSEEEKPITPKEVPVFPGGISPIDALRRRMNVTSVETAEEPANSLPETQSPKKEEPTVSDAPAAEEKEAPEPSSLLKRCMPYIYDEEGISQVDTKPDYVLESVDDIIKAAEARAKEKIAERYRFTDETGRARPVKIEKLETSVKEEPAEAPVPEETKKAETAEVVVVSAGSGILFDDFSGKRTVVTEHSTVTTPYSDISSSSDAATENTVTVPTVRPTKVETMEDIVSHTRPVNVSDAPAIKPQKPVAVTIVNDDTLPEVDDDYRSPDDTKRIGMMLKKQRRTAFFRLVIAFIATAVSAVFAILLPDTLFLSAPFVPCLVQFGLLCVCSLSDISIFASFKTAFTKKATAAAPVALCLSSMLVYMIFGLILGTYPSRPVLIALMAFAAYSFFSYRRASDILNNFKIVASRTEKKAVALIDDQATASSMARSSIEGEVLAAGVKRTAVITDFLKHTAADSAFSGHLSAMLTVFSVVAFIFALITGISYHSFDTALCTMSLVLCFFAMPTYSFAEFMPLNGLSKKLYSLGAMVCGKYSASKIEQANAVVITSAELFPDGCLELYNMKTLSANNIDRTLNCAASIAEAIGSPLASVFGSFISGAENRPAADTIKYEDNLGISGWVGDDHFFIGNRTLMEAHGIKVPSLEVDRKILHRGYFPIYVAEGGRACALLIVKYMPSRKVRNDLVKLVNAGITLLIDNCDSNITAPMISEYYSIYEDSIKVMDHKGIHNYKSAVNYSETHSAHAAFVGKTTAFFSIISGALRLKTTSNILYALHIVLSAIACVVFILAALDGRMMLMQIPVCAVIELICLAASTLTYLISKK